jgi:hypothetical protein
VLIPHKAPDLPLPHAAEHYPLVLQLATDPQIKVVAEVFNNYYARLLHPVVTTALNYYKEILKRVAKTRRDCNFILFYFFSAALYIITNRTF